MKSLAAVIITKNEERNIARCLQSLDFCDEIIVVDAESVDRTCEIARTFNAQVSVRPFTNFSDQRNFALGKASAHWILSIDADEEVSPELRREIEEWRGRTSEEAAYYIARKTFHFNRWIRYGGWYPNRLVRLFDKSRGEWRGDELHEYWYSRGKVGALQADLLHYSFQDLADQVERNNRYSSLGALKLYREKKAFSLLRMTVKSCSKFVETYFLKLGFLDGYPGLIISVSAAYSVFLKWAKLWELELEKEKTK